MATVGEPSTAWRYGVDISLVGSNVVSPSGIEGGINIILDLWSYEEPDVLDIAFGSWFFALNEIVMDFGPGYSIYFSSDYYEEEFWNDIC